MLRWNFILNRKRQTRYLFLLILNLLLAFEIVDIGKAKNSNFVQLQDCKTTTSSIGLDIVLPIQAGGEQFQTGDWVYQTKGSDHTGKDSCALDFWDVDGMRAVAVADGKVQVAKWNNPKDPLDGYGYYVILIHEKNGVNYYSLYSHLLDPDSKDFPSECKMFRGKNVKVGECVGISDATGHAIPSGFPHMHFAIWSGTDPFNNTHAIAPEISRGLKLYGTLSPHTKVTTMATAEIDNRILPSLTLKLNEVQQRNFAFTNTSKIDWDQKNKFELVRVSENSPGTPKKVTLRQVIKPGESTTITLNIKGTTPGIFESEWQLHHNGVAFGPIVPLRYTVGVNVDDISNLPTNLWQLIKPMIMNWIEDQISHYINQLLQDLLNNIYQLCGIIPLGTIGIFFGAVIAKQRQPSWKLKWSGQGSWFSVIQTVVGMGIIFLFATLLLIVGRELIWWSGVIKNTGIIVLVLSGLLSLWGVLRFIKWIKDTGFKRLIVILLIILIPTTYFHGQRYRIDEPITARYLYSIGDLTLITKDNFQNYWKESKEFINELAVLLEE